MPDNQVVRTVASENPTDHWCDLEVADQVVLDLGCGLFGLPLEWNTPGYFLSRGAAAVVGVDFDPGAFEEIRERVASPALTLVRYEITTAADIAFLLGRYNPSVVKCDIEGREHVLDGVPATSVAGVHEWSIEYHNPEAEAICRRKLAEWGYAVGLIRLMNYSLEIGVLHATRPAQ